MKLRMAPQYFTCLVFASSPCVPNAHNKKKKVAITRMENTGGGESRVQV